MKKNKMFHDILLADMEKIENCIFETDYRGLVNEDPEKYDEDSIRMGIRIGLSCVAFASWLRKAVKEKKKEG